MRKRKDILCALIFSVLVFGGSRPGYGDEPLKRMTPEQAFSKFVAGNLAYQAGDYDRAVMEYTAVLRAGMESGALYYNLANSYFKKEDLGKAVVNYERAKRFLPRDGDVEFNYQYAIAQARRIFSEGKQGVAAGLMDRHLAFYTEREMAWIIVVLSFLIAAAHIASLYGKWPLRLRRGVLGVLAAFWVLYVSSFAVKVQASEGLAVVTGSTDARFEPRADATAHFALGEGERIKVLKAEGGWAKVTRSDGKSGWVPQQFFEYIL